MKRRTEREREIEKGTSENEAYRLNIIAIGNAEEKLGRSAARCLGRHRG
jgi:hypothetical protein